MIETFSAIRELVKRKAKITNHKEYAVLDKNLDQEIESLKNLPYIQNFLNFLDLEMQKDVYNNIFGAYTPQEISEYIKNYYFLGKTIISDNVDACSKATRRAMKRYEEAFHLF